MSLSIWERQRRIKRAITYLYGIEVAAAAGA